VAHGVLDRERDRVDQAVGVFVLVLPEEL
jgi:hypothetical protein